jgi:hypothetical protein
VLFSSERQRRVRAYHGSEEPRTQPAGVGGTDFLERTAVAFDCYNGRFRCWPSDSSGNLFEGNSGRFS